MYITLLINFWKLDRVSATMEQLPAGLVKPEPYQASWPIVAKTLSVFYKLIMMLCTCMYALKSLHKHKIQTEAP